jgi:Domain of unknown function (DUF4412)
MRYGVFILAAGLIGAPVAGAYADVTVISETTGADGVASARTMYLTADRMKVDTPKFALIFEIGAGKMVNSLKDKKQYMEVDVKALGARINDATAMMKQKLESVPEAQRKMIEAMMAQHSGLPGVQKAVATTYEKTGESKTIGAWPCEMFHLKRDGKLVADLCIAKADAVGLTADDLAVLHNLAATMVKSLPEGITRNGAVMDFDEQSKQIGFAGVPVETTLHLNGAALSTTIVKSVDHAPIAPDTFVIPAGYAKRDMPGLTIGQ